jgi:hypothetical protein
MKRFIAIFLFIGWIPEVKSQCEFLLLDKDEFDSTITVATPPINIGFLMGTDFLEADGLKMVEEAKLMLSFGENDSIRSFFLTLAAIENEYLEIDQGFNILLKLSNDSIIGLYNFPDRGEFDRKINMRIYRHQAIVPIDVYYSLIHFEIEKIRIQYKGYKRTITITPSQQKRIIKQFRCLGEGAGLYPIKP